MLNIPYTNGKQEMSLQYGNPIRILLLSLSLFFPIKAQYTQTKMLSNRAAPNKNFNISNPYLWGSVISALLGLIDFPILFVLGDIWKYMILVLLVMCSGMCFTEFVNHLRAKQQIIKKKDTRWFYVRLKPASFGNAFFLICIFVLQLEILKFCIILLNHPTIIEIVVLIFVVFFNQVLSMISYNLCDFKIGNEVFVPYNKSKYNFSKLD